MFRILFILCIRAVYGHVAGPFLFIAVASDGNGNQRIGGIISLVYNILFSDGNTDGAVGRSYYVAWTDIDILIGTADALQHALYIVKLKGVVIMRTDIRICTCHGKIHSEGCKVRVIYRGIIKEIPVGIEIFIYDILFFIRVRG